MDVVGFVERLVEKLKLVHVILVEFMLNKDCKLEQEAVYELA